MGNSPRFITAAEVEGGVIPAGGEVDQVLAKESSTDYDLKWANAGGGGTPAGLNTQLQFNNVGAFGGTGGDNIDHQGVHWVDETKTLVLNGFDGSDGNILSIMQAAQSEYGYIFVSDVPADFDFSMGLNNMFRLRGTGALTFQAPANNITMMSFYRKTNTSPTGNFLVLNDALANPLFAVDINGILKLTPTTEPASPVEGMVYAGTDHHLYYYNGTTWKQLDN